MNILLTGATGFLGSTLLRRMINDGHNASVLKRSTSSLNRINGVQDHVRFFDCGLTSFEDVFSSSNFDAVVNTACCYGRSGETAAELLEANLLFEVKMLQCCADRNIPFINTGSYLSPLVNGYALSKSQLEQWMDYFSGDCKAVTIKLDHMYGPGDDARKFAGMLLNHFDKDTPEINLTEGGQTRDFIHINDVVDLFLRVLDSLDELNERTIIVAGSCREISVRDFVIMLRNIWQAETGRECVAKFNFGIVPYRKHEIMRTRIDPVVIVGEPWHTKVKLEDGLKDYVRWFIKENTEKK